jgi:hypothetical protein
MLVLFLLFLMQGILAVPFGCLITIIFMLLFQLFLQLKILGMLPSLASHSVMIPLIVQTILPMLHKDAKPYVL